MLSRRPILSGTAANSAGLAMNAIVQLLSVPILLSAWGAEDYGIWVMLATIPTYIALSDLGFLQAATSDMAMQLAKGRREQAIATLQSITVLMGLIAVLVLFSVLALLSCFGTGAASLLHPHRATVFALALFAVLSMVSRVPLAALRSAGRYATGTVVHDVLVFIEGLAMLAVVLRGGRPEAAALTLAIGRAANLVVMNLLLRRQVPWLSPGVAKASVSEVRRLLKPALAAMTIPAALAINLQGVVLIIGLVMSPLAVATFVPVRTFSRLMVQFVGVVNRATMPEMSRAYASSDADRVAAILRINSLSLVCVLLPGGLLFALFGKDVVQVWSGGHITPSQGFVALMSMAAVIHGIWYFASNLLMATNAHVPLAGFALLAALMTIGLVMPLGAAFGLQGAAFALICGESLCLAATFRLFLSRYRRSAT